MLSGESPPFLPSSMASPAAARQRSPSDYTSGSSVGSDNTSNVISNSVPVHTFPTADGKHMEIRNVWAENLEQEMAYIRENVIEKHPYVAMDTEFPGVVARPVMGEQYAPDYHYKSLKCNVDLLKIIQLGLCFADENGDFNGTPCWQFNFKFDINSDMFAQDSIDLLTHSGISFKDHATHGIDPIKFGELLTVSGLVLDDRVKWVSFHSGYDYAYLLKVLTSQDLPENEKGFFDNLKLFFPTIYDIKYMTSLCDGNYYGGLQKLADELKCSRVGTEHQAGSDSLLTMTTYFALAEKKFKDGNTDSIDDSKYKNELYGYGSNHTVHKSRSHAAAQSGGGGGINNNNGTASSNNLLSKSGSNPALYGGYNNNGDAPLQ